MGETDALEGALPGRTVGKPLGIEIGSLLIHLAETSVYLYDEKNFPEDPIPGGDNGLADVLSIQLGTSDLALLSKLIINGLAYFSGYRKGFERGMKLYELRTEDSVEEIAVELFYGLDELEFYARIMEDGTFQDPSFGIEETIEVGGFQNYSFGKVERIGEYEFLVDQSQGINAIAVYPGYVVESRFPRLLSTEEKICISGENPFVSFNRPGFLYRIFGPKS